MAPKNLPPRTRPPQPPWPPPASASAPAAPDFFRFGKTVPTLLLLLIQGCRRAGVGSRRQGTTKEAQQDRKKSPIKRITGFEFSPANQSKLMITSADSQVRILDGVDVIAKYRGLRNGGSRISTSFTSDGKHIISASEDSNVYVWNYSNQDTPTTKNVKSTRSCERIYSSDASVAITWSGFEPKSPVSVLVSPELHPPEQEVTVDQTMNTEADFHDCADSLGHSNVYLSPVGSFTVSQEMFSEFMPKGTATWPEEELPAAACSSLCKSQYKLLKSSCQNESSVWGQVIVTAGWDGRIRSFRNFGLPVQH